MTKSQAHAIRHAHLSFLQSAQHYDDTNNTELLSLAVAIDGAKSKLYSSTSSTSASASALSGEQKIFVRLSTRSPKDAPLLLPDFKERVKQCRQRLTALDSNNDQQQQQENTALHALQIASTVAMGVDTGRDAVRLLVLSKRIQGDLEQFCNDELHVASDSAKSFKVAVRKFQYFPLDFELRAFVYQGRLTAITQYNPFIYFPALVARKATIQQLVNQFIEQVFVFKSFVFCYVIVKNR